jgi:hypothetical protein
MAGVNVAGPGGPGNGGAQIGVARRGAAWHGMAGMARQAGRGKAVFGGNGLAVPGSDRQRQAGMARKR